MARTLDRLREEHRAIERLLKAIEHQLAIFERGDRPDYDVLEAAADYFSDFPDRCHHPKEDAVYRRMRTIDARAADATMGLESEHRRIGELVRQFRETVCAVLADREVPRAGFLQFAHDFVDEQRRHLAEEETRFFPLAERLLSDADWAAVDAETPEERDPLFGAETASKFDALRDDILRWEAEDEAADQVKDG
jgi:hemerythrin-like domain-containing protein